MQDGVLKTLICAPPRPIGVAQAAAISVPLVVAGVLGGVAISMFVSHRVYMSRRGVEVAKFSIIGDEALNMHRNLSRRGSVADMNSPLAPSRRVRLPHLISSRFSLSFFPLVFCFLVHWVQRKQKTYQRFSS
jgi:hypothetical protein